MVVDAMIRAAAVGGVASMWCYFTLKTFKICEQIVFIADLIFLPALARMGLKGFMYANSVKEKKTSVNVVENVFLMMKSLKYVTVMKKTTSLCVKIALHAIEKIVS